MSNPLWPDPATLSFKLFGKQGEAPTSTTPFAQGLAGGMDLIKKFWGNLPGGSAVPGFLVPTLDVAELDKRLSDLRAAESWVEVNLNMLRATIQGLEVQRNTIATIQSLSAMTEGSMTAAPAPAEAPATGLPSSWPMTPPAPVPQAPTAEAPRPSEVAPAEAPTPAASATSEPDPVVSLATDNWLGFMQQQFMKVAQAAIAPPADTGPSPRAAKAARKPAARSTTATPAKKAKRRLPAAR